MELSMEEKPMGSHHKSSTFLQKKNIGFGGVGDCKPALKISTELGPAHTNLTLHGQQKSGSAPSKVPCIYLV